MEKQLAIRIGQKHGARILDAGCGEALVAIRLAKEKPWIIYGIDLLKPYVDIAKKNVSKAGLEGKVIVEVGDYTHLDFPDNYFNAVYTVETLVHSPDYKRTLREFYRVLKPGGVLVNFEYALEDDMTPEQEEPWRHIYENGAMMGVFKDFRIKRMQQIWDRAGFVDVRVDGVTKNVAPFMKRLYQIAFVPFHILKLFGKEKNYTNTYVGYISFGLRDQFQYSLISAVKPSSRK